MGSITVRKRKDGSAAYAAQIRIMQKGVTVYQESQTFDRKTTAQVWIKRRETEMAESGAIAKANRMGITVKEMNDRYLVGYRPSEPPSKQSGKPGLASLRISTSPVPDAGQRQLLRGRHPHRGSRAVSGAVPVDQVEQGPD